MVSVSKMRLVAAAFVCPVVLVAASGCSPTPAVPAPIAGAGVLPPSTPGAAGTLGAAGTTPVGSVPPRAGTPGVPAAGSGAPIATAGGAAPPGTGEFPTTPPAAGAAAIAGAGGPTTPPPVVGSNADWPMMGYDVGNSYLNSAETVLTKANAANLKEAWVAEMGGNTMGAPLQVGDKIYAAAPGFVAAYNAADGMQLWKTSSGSTATLAYAGGSLYQNNNDGKIVAFNAADGKMLWTKPADTQASDGSSSPIIAGDTILIGGSNGSAELTGGGTFRGYLSALNRMTGDILWTTYNVPMGSLGASIWSSASADLTLGVAYAGTGNNYSTPASDTSDAFIAYDLKTGTIKWKNQRLMNDVFPGIGPDSDFGANPVLYETLVGGVMTQLIAAGAKSGSAHAVRRDNGMMVWSRSLGGGASDGSSGIFTNSAWSGKNILVAENTGGRAVLYALDGATGDIAWMRSLAGAVWGRMAVANGVGFVGAGGTLDVFDVDTGAQITMFASKGGTIASGITVSNGRVAFGEGFSWSSGVRGTKMTVLTVK